MSVPTTSRSGVSSSTALFPSTVVRGVTPRFPPTGRFTMYAIAFDMDTDTLRKSYGNDSYNNAYADIRRVLEEYHFSWQQGSVYYGDPAQVNAVSCVLAVMELTRRYPWFAPSVRDIRMLRIEEQNDLMSAVRDAIKR